MNNKINRLFKVLIIILLATYGNLYISAKIKAETISTPIIKSITLEKNGQDLEPGDTTKIIVDIDLNRGPAIKKVALAIQRSDLTSSEDRHYVYPTLNLATGKYEATYVVPTQMYNGEYLLNYIHVENDAGKSTFKFDILGKFTVINGLANPNTGSIDIIEPIVNPIVSGTTNVSGIAEALSTIKIFADRKSVV